MTRLPKRVLHILNAPVGGAAISTVSLMRAFRAQGVESVAVCHDTVGRGPEADAIREATDGRAVFTPLYWWNRKERAALWKRPLLEARQNLLTQARVGSLARVLQAVRKFDVKLIHTNTMVTPEGAYTARLLGLPHVWHVRELVGPGEHIRLPYDGARLGQFLTRHASVLVANSNASARCLEAYVPREFLRVVPNGIDVSRFDLARTATRDPGRVVVGMVANVTSVLKNHALFIEALSHTKERNSEFRIYGYDDMESKGARSHGARLRELASRLAVSDRLVFRGFVNSPETIMGEIDVLVHPVPNESFGRVLVEAMSAGLPVVGPNGGGVGEIVVDGETGFHSRDGDARDLAEKIDRLVGSQALRKKMGESGRARVESTYSLAACVAGVGAAYDYAMNHPVRIPHALQVLGFNR